MFSTELVSALDTVSRAETGVAMAVRDLSGKPIANMHGDPVELILCGSDSDRFRRAKSAAMLERTKALAGREVTVDDMRNGDAKGIDIIATCTVGWSGVLDTAGKVVPFTPENVRAFYAAFPIAYEQADAFVGARANFLPKPLTASAGTASGISNE